MWFWVRPQKGLRLALAGARREVGLTQAELAERIRANRGTVIDMEAGRNPSINRFIRAFNMLGYDLIAVPRTAKVRVELKKKQT